MIPDMPERALATLTEAAPCALCGREATRALVTLADANEGEYRMTPICASCLAAGVLTAMTTEPPTA